MANPLYVNWRQRNPLKQNQEFRKLGIPMFTEEEKQLPFKDRIAKFFVEHGNYRITPKAETLLEVKAQLKKRGTTVGYEQKDSISNRDKDEKYIEGLASITPKEKKRVIAEIIADLIDEGKWQYLFISEAVKTAAPCNYWSDKKTRVSWIQELVKYLKKDLRDIIQADFLDNRLKGLLNHYYSSPFKAISEAYPEEIREWEMLKTPRNFYNKKKNRVAAVKWLVKKLNKNPRDLTWDDFENNRLPGLITEYKHSPFVAVSEVYPELNVTKEEMKHAGRPKKAVA